MLSLWEKHPTFEVSKAPSSDRVPRAAGPHSGDGSSGCLRLRGRAVRRLKITPGGGGMGAAATPSTSEGYLAGPGPRNQGGIGGRGQRGRFHRNYPMTGKGPNQSPEPRAWAPSGGPSDFARRGL